MKWLVSKDDKFKLVSFAQLHLYHMLGFELEVILEVDIQLLFGIQSILMSLCRMLATLLIFSIPLVTGKYVSCKPLLSFVGCVNIQSSPYFHDLEWAAGGGRLIKADIRYHLCCSNILTPLSYKIDILYWRIMGLRQKPRRWWPMISSASNAKCQSVSKIRTYRIAPGTLLYYVQVPHLPSSPLEFQGILYRWVICLSNGKSLTPFLLEFQGIFYRWLLHLSNKTSFDYIAPWIQKISFTDYSFIYLDWHLWMLLFLWYYIETV